MRVVIADDVMLVRSGLARLLSDEGVEVVGEAAEPEELLRIVAREHPDVAIVDIRMPPTFTDEGLAAARRIRSEHPATGVVLLSQHVVAKYAAELLADQPGGVGYLLKERVANIAVLIDALERIAADQCVLEPAIVSTLMRRKPGNALDTLTARETDVLIAMAEGRSNAGIARELHLSERTVESLTAQVFAKLGLEQSPDDNRRVLAVLRLLGSKRAEREPTTSKPG